MPGLYGRTALHIAAAGGHFVTIGTLISGKADMEHRTEGGLTALHIAAEKGHVDAVRMLLSMDCDVCPQSWLSQETPLHLAASRGHREVVDCLLEAAPHCVNTIRNSFGQRPSDVCMNAETLRIFQNFGCSSLGSTLGSSICSSGSASSCSSASLRAAQDKYAARTVLEMGRCEAVLLRNSRADFVQRIIRCTEVTRQLQAQDDTETKVYRRFSESRVTSSSAGTVATRRKSCFSPLQDSALPLEVVSPEDFKLERRLGKGSFGEVFRVTHKVTGEVYAMKVLKKEKIRRQNCAHYAISERNLLSYMRHPFIVRLHYAFQTYNCLVLVLQYCALGNLRTLILKERGLSEAVVQLHAAELLMAIEYLHARQVVYRDMKPDNIVLDDGCHALLTDFGLSKEGIEGLQSTKSFVGSFCYVAPEVIARTGHGPMVDIYGLGVVMFEAVACQPPFYHRDREQLQRNITGAQFYPPARASPVAGQLIQALMRRDPSKRLGAKDRSEIRAHAFFESLDFELVLQRKVPCPPLRNMWPGMSLESYLLGGLHEEKVVSPFETRFEASVRRACSRSGQPQELPIPGWDFVSALPMARSSAETPEADESRSAAATSDRRASRPIIRRSRISLTKNGGHEAAAASAARGRGRRSSAALSRVITKAKAWLGPFGRF